jgi:hypothetical protein
MRFARAQGCRAVSGRAYFLIIFWQSFSVTSEKSIRLSDGKPRESILALFSALVAG